MHATERDTERIQRLRVEYWQALESVKLTKSEEAPPLQGGVSLTDLVFIDEAGVNLGMNRRYARSLKGTRAYGDCPDARGQNVTMIQQFLQL